MSAITEANGKDSRVLVACGAKIYLLDVANGAVISHWSANDTHQATPQHDDADEDERPKKKQKTKAQVQVQPVVLKLAISPDQRHAVAVTDDKYVRVFSIEDNRLEELSQRCMPKRPCALDILPDNATIICGDKFGDVYSLPLLPAESPEQDTNTGASQEPQPEQDKAAFKPSATNLTVHTQRNRKTLEMQQQQQKFTTKKEPLKFEHKLLLGHVSMLTDLAFATHKVEEKIRSYIITADRDEHIRVSRGPPQSYIIEGYCLGHNEFVSKIRLIPGTNWLVSGGGDDWLGVWNWPEYRLHRRISLGDAFQPGDTKVIGPVSGLWTVPYQAATGLQLALVIAMERQPCLLVMPIEQLQLKGHQPLALTCIALDYPPLDVVTIGENLVVSLDAREVGQTRLQAFQLRHHNGDHVRSERNTELETKLGCLDQVSQGPIGEAKALDDLLYNVGGLRKRRGWGEDGEGENNGEDEDAEKAPEDDGVGE
ncbi:hypothetical protein LTR62_006558 [Meristemomyces frigidus]|uniref:Transfer RNA methyltransferase 82 n=1 Tax=Meristemomyces frigidus TaxID=1508187 RepID=A0AAN7YEF2_9PEZI|nr:hypothetical protein LTR62_006558 [Meristemomyces frigidus]